MEVKEATVYDSKHREELEGKLQSLKELEQLPGWKLVLATMQSQLILLRAQHIQSPVDSMDGAFAAAKRQGQISGLQQSIACIEQLQQAFEADLAVIYEEMSNVNDTDADTRN